MYPMQVKLKKYTGVSVYHMYTMWVKLKEHIYVSIYHMYNIMYNVGKTERSCIYLPHVCAMQVKFKEHSGVSIYHVYTMYVKLKEQVMYLFITCIYNVGESKKSQS